MASAHWLVSTQIITLVSSAWPTMMVAAVPDGTMERAFFSASMLPRWCFLCSGWQLAKTEEAGAPRCTRTLTDSNINKESKLHVVGVRRHVVGDVRQRRQVELLLLRGEAVGRRFRRFAREEPHFS